MGLSTRDKRKLQRARNLAFARRRKEAKEQRAKDIKAGRRVTFKTSRGKTVTVGIPVSEARKKEIFELERKSISDNFARARLRGDVIKRSGVLIPKTKVGRQVLSQALAVDKRLKVKTTSATDKRIRELNNLIRGKVLTDAGRQAMRVELTDLLRSPVVKSIDKRLRLVKRLVAETALARETFKRERALALKDFDERVTSRLSASEKKLLLAISESAKKRERFTISLDNTYKRLGLSKRQGDRRLIGILKGTARGFVGLTAIPGITAIALDNALLMVQALALKHFRRTTKSELLNAFKKVPRTVWNSVDPRDPENWAGVLLIAIGVRSIAKNSLKGDLSLLELTRLKIKPSSKIGKNLLGKIPKPKSAISITALSTRLAKKVVSDRIKIVKRQIDNTIRQLKKPKKEGLSVIIDGKTILEPSRSIVSKLKKNLRVIKKQLLKAKTKVEVARINARLRENKIKFELPSKQRKFKLRLEKAKKLRVKQKLKAPIKKVKRFTKQKFDVLKTKSLDRLDILRFKLQEQLKLLTKAKDKQKLRLEIIQIEVIIKFKKALLSADNSLKLFVKNKSRIIDAEFLRLKRSLKGKSDKVLRSRVVLKIRIILSRATTFVNKVKATFRAIKTLGSLSKMLLRLKSHQALNSVKSLIKPITSKVKIIKKRVTTTKKRLKIIKETGKEAARLKAIQLTRKVKGRLREGAKPLKAKVKGFKKGVKVKLRKAVIRAKPIQVGKRVVRKLKVLQLIVREGVRNSLLLALRRRGVSIVKPIIKRKRVVNLRSFVKSGEKPVEVSLKKGGRDFSVIVNSDGRVVVFEAVDVPVGRGVLGKQLVRLDTLRVPKTSVLESSVSLKPVVSRLVLGVFRAVNKSLKVKPKIRAALRFDSSLIRASKMGQLLDRLVGSKNAQDLRLIVRSAVGFDVAQDVAQRSKLVSSLKLKTKLKTKFKKKFKPKAFKKDLDKVKKVVLKKVVNILVRKDEFFFIPDLFSAVFNIRAGRRESKALLRPNRLFTGAELRKLVR